MQPPRAECELREMTVLTNGCLVAQGDWQQNERRPWSHFNAMVAEREPFTTGAKFAEVGGDARRREQPAALWPPGIRTEVPLGAWIGSGVDTPGSGGLPPASGGCPRIWSRPSACSAR